MREERQPPRWAQRFIEWYCKPQVAEDLLGDLNEYFERNAEAVGVRRAKLIYIIDALKFFRSYTIRKPQLVLNSQFMINSYIKTSGRNLMRNKLFSSINIVGLAISMSVGLLMIAFLHDLSLYDKFHEKGDRIYRVNSQPLYKEGSGNEFASNSIRAGQLIREKISGVEETTIVRNDFRNDVAAGENVVTMRGLWAEPSFIKMFSFQLIKGDASTALNDPYSIILTEQSSKNLFGDKDAFGKTVTIDSTQYSVTGIVKDLPFYSHMRFDALVSFSTAQLLNKENTRFESWASTWQNYVYVLLPAGTDENSIQLQLDAIAEKENTADENEMRALSLQPLFGIALGKNFSNPIGPTMPSIAVWIVGALALIVILSACFNYTNLSIARSMRRFKEIGLRKVIGAGRTQVRQQFLSEAVIVSLLALIISFFLFLLLRDGFLGLAPELQGIVKLELSPSLVGMFIVFSIVTGVIAGFIPALFFAKVSVIKALKDLGTVKVFGGLSMRRSLVVVQYTMTLIFITATIIGYTQYQDMLRLDLGFDTENIVNVQLQGNKPDGFVNGLREIPEVTAISQSAMVTSLGTYWNGYVRYKGQADSIVVAQNIVDENYFPLHGHKFVSGQNFIERRANSEVIVNEKTIKEFNIADGDVQKSIGEVLVADGKKLTIVGVLKDFHFGKADNPIEPVLFLYLTPEVHGVVNIKVQSTDLPATMAKIEMAWKVVDKIHPIEARFYDDAIENAYSEFLAMLKIIGFLAFLAISIASLGLFGMVVFTTETRLKEISIRKVMGAGSGHLVFLLSRGFMILLGTSAVIALPLTYFFFEQVVLTNFPFHNPIGFIELFTGLAGVILIAVIMICSQTLKAAQTNPAQVLKNE